MIVYPAGYESITREYLLDFFSTKKNLLISDQWINENNHSDIASLCKDIDHVIIDLSHNPTSLNTIEQCKSIDLPVSKTILVNNFEYFYKPEFNVCWFPVFFYIWNVKKKFWYPHVDFEFRNDPKIFNISCLNSSPSLHRILFYQQIEDLVKNKKIMFTFGRLSQARYDTTWDMLDYSEKEWVIKKQLEQNFETDQELNYDYDVGIAHDAYQKTALNIVTETTVFDDFLTEKICKPLASNQFFITISEKNTIKLLKDLGFDVFDDIVMHSRWDSLDDFKQRIINIGNYLRLVVDFNWTKLSKSCFDRLDKNRQYLFSTEFNNVITKQIKSRALHIL